MTPFVDAIDRLFQELVHEAWRAPQPSQPQPRQLLPGSILELRLPISSASCGDVAFAVEGQRLTVTVRQRATESIEGTDAAMVRDSERHFQQSITLPGDTEPATIEVCFDVDALRLRIALRSRSRD